MQKINKLILKILNHFVDLENESKLQLEYYTSKEMDGNGTIFEGLSNGNRLGIKTKLPEDYSSVILKILHGILEENLHIFETMLDGSVEIDDQDLKKNENL